MKSYAGAFYGNLAEMYMLSWAECAWLCLNFVPNAILAALVEAPICTWGN